MRRLSILLTLALVAACASPIAAQQADEARAYLQAKAHFDTLFKGRGFDSVVLVDGRVALKDLETRMRRLVGQDSIFPVQRRFTLTWFPGSDAGGWGLDGMVQYDPQSRTRVLVTTPAVLSAWLKQIGKWTPDPTVGVTHEDALTWVFDLNAHVYPFTDLRDSSTSREVFFASLVAVTNGDVLNPADVMVGVNTGRRIYMMLAPAAVYLDFESACGNAGGPGYQACFKRNVRNHPDFPLLVAQARRLAALVNRR